MIPFLPSPDSKSITLYLCLWYARKAAVMQIRTTTVLCAHARRGGGEEGSAMTMGRKYCAIDAAIALSLPLPLSLSSFVAGQTEREREETAFGSLFICERRDRPHDGNFAQRYYYY